MLGSFVKRRDWRRKKIRWSYAPPRSRSAVWRFRAATSRSKAAALRALPGRHARREAGTSSSRTALLAGASVAGIAPPGAGARASRQAKATADEAAPTQSGRRVGEAATGARPAAGAGRSFAAAVY